MKSAVRRPKVVIVGGGIGGLSAAQALSGHSVDVMLADRKNHHTFQPLLYQVATAVLAPGEIASPLRYSASRTQRRSDHGRVTGFDTMRGVCN